jgi:hypothetical protein
MNYAEFTSLNLVMLKINVVLEKRTVNQPDGEPTLFRRKAIKIRHEIAQQLTNLICILDAPDSNLGLAPTILASSSQLFYRLPGILRDIWLRKCFSSYPFQCIV